jgi:DNA polymerase
MLITIDFETYYGPGCGFKTQNTEEYIRDPRFEVIGFSLKINDQPTRWYTGDREYLRAVLAQVDWSKAALLAHNCKFDAAVLHWHFGFKPARYMDTLSMGRGLVGLRTGLSLEKLGVFYQLKRIKGHEVDNAYDKRRLDFTPAEMSRYGGYCCNDTDMCFDLASVMIPKMVPAELELVDWTIRCFVEPKLVFNEALLERELAAYYVRREKLLADVGITDVAVLRSDATMAQYLEQLGVDLPVKLSPKQKNPDGSKKQVYAFSRQDVEFMALLDSDDEQVVALVEARIGAKSSIIESRLLRLLGMSRRGPAPMPLSYAGAITTRRWAGEDGINVQNFTRNKQAPDGTIILSPLREAICAPPGKRMASADQAQIELRVNAWQSGQQDVLDKLAAGIDVYSDTASDTFGFPVDKKKHPNERFVGKTQTLGCGYQCGDVRFRAMLRTDARKYGIVLQDSSEAFCKRAVQSYRAKYRKIVGFWYEADRALETLAFGLEGRLGPYRISDYKLWLPDGNYLSYPDLRYLEKTEEGEIGCEWSYERWDWKARRLVRKKMFGGKFVENITQAVARIFIAEAIRRLDTIKYADGTRVFDVVFSVHDEIVVLFDEHLDDDYVKQCLRWAMLTPLPWAATLPLACDIGIGLNYAACK